MSDVKERAETVAAMPHVKRWMKRFRKVAADMPKEVWVYVASGTPCVMVNGEDGKPIYRGDGVELDSKIDSLRRGSWDGGDW